MANTRTDVDESVVVRFDQKIQYHLDELFETLDDFAHRNRLSTEQVVALLSERYAEVPDAYQEWIDG